MFPTESPSAYYVSSAARAKRMNLEPRTNKNATGKLVTHYGKLKAKLMKAGLRNGEDPDESINFHVVEEGN